MRRTNHHGRGPASLARALGLVALGSSVAALSCEHSLDFVGTYDAKLADAGDGAGAGGASSRPDSGLFVPDAASAGGASGASTVDSLPTGYTGTEIGGYKLGNLLSTSDVPDDAGSASSNSCGNVFLGVVRDFRSATETGGHPDFESYMPGGVTPNLVAATLGSDSKPVYSSPCGEGAAVSTTCPSGQETSTQANFDQWYRDTPGVNVSYELFLYFARSDGLFTFDSKSFFPLDGAGFGNTAMQDHNFSFTTELHTRFRYRGGETFSFAGDDDVWVYINAQLAVDLGGIHATRSQEVDLDAQAEKLGLTVGEIYALDLFQAERHTTESDIRIDTDLAFVNCGEVVK